MNATYQVVLTGIKPGSLPERVQEDVAGLFKIPVARASALLGQPRSIVKRGVLEAVAAQYQQSFEAVGAVCIVEAEALVDPLSLRDQLAPAASTGSAPPKSAPASYCPKCGTRSAGGAFCESCGVPLSGGSSSGVSMPVGAAPAPSDSPKGDRVGAPASLAIERSAAASGAAAQPFGFQNASDAITANLGIERIESFSLGVFFSQVFKKHDPDDVENLFSVGTNLTTPKLAESMGGLPNPWIFFRVLVGALATYAIFYVAYKHFHNTNLVPGLILLGSFAVPFAVLILFFELNTPRNVSITRTIQMLMAGGALSLLVSLFLFEVTPFLGIFGASAAGIVEESGKLLAVLVVLRFIPIDRYPHRLNGLLFGAAVGTGFAAFESAGYALRIGLVNVDAMLDNITLRGAMSPFAHIAWTAIATCGYLSARKHCADFASTIKDRRFYIIFAVPVVLHFVWNLGFEGPFMIKYWALGFIAWVVILSLVQTGLREIKADVAGSS